jgi:hypothetical protein
MDIDADQDSYHLRVVAFADILGFSAMVKRADDQFWRDAIERVVAMMRDTVKPSKMLADQRVTQFSDCVVISANAAYESSLVLVTVGMVTLADALLQQGVLIRGGIAVGNLVHTDERLFGEGLLLAYRKDESGSPPRIAVDPSVEPFINAAPHFPVERLFIEDSYDLTTMLDTLYRYRTYHPGELSDSSERLENVAEKIIPTIVQNCWNIEHPPSVRAKWRWMARYWDQAVSELGVLPETRFLEPEQCYVDL